MTGENRKEDKALTIYNDHSHGSSEIFEDAQLALFEEIVLSADGFFYICPPESQKYNSEGHFKEVPIFLVPYRTFLMKMVGKCQRMNALYLKEVDRIKKGHSQEELERRLAKLRKQFEGWICPSYPSSCIDCKRVFSTPLGYYVPDEGAGKIYICLDRIKELYPQAVTEVSAVVILHELGHAIMHNPKHPSYESFFEYWVEESLANKIALKYLSVASDLLSRPALFDEAKSMVQGQPLAYKRGLDLFELNALDWYTLKENKVNINMTMGNRWVDLLSDSPMGKYDEIQRMFFRAFENTAVKSSSAPVFESWLKGKVKDGKSLRRYVATVTSSYIGVVFKEMMGWSYCTLADCNSSLDIQDLINRLEVKDSEESYFNIGTYGGALPAVKKYYEFLRSLGV